MTHLKNVKHEYQTKSNEIVASYSNEENKKKKKKKEKK